MSKKPVIVFEGIEGSGKTYHLNLISKYLKKKKISYIKLREPGGFKNSEKIRRLILNNKTNFNENTDLLLYLAARSENIKELKKNYKKKIILIDRFTDSTIAYQHYGLNVNLSLIKKINNFLIKDFKVNFTFLNLVSKSNMISRLKKRKKLNRYDKFDYSFYSKVQKGFLKLAKNKKNYQLINSDLNIEFNRKLIENTVDRILK
tara:strand:+ start:259 stop:870 length:612 start_codon:yes stop_codon:yes gene_type:complete